MPGNGIALALAALYVVPPAYAQIQIGGTTHTCDTLGSTSNCATSQCSVDFGGQSLEGTVSAGWKDLPCKANIVAM